MQVPEPWTSENEARYLWAEMQSVLLAEELGFDTAWICEHHALGKRAHCSAPDVILAALSQLTSRIRLGHAVIELHPAINPVVRVAERLATLDILSRGRVEAGIGRASVNLDVLAFNLNVTREEIHDIWLEGVSVLPRIWTESEFSFDGTYFVIPKTNIVPKPYQKPHPPLWTAVQRPASWAEAGRLGLGVLTPAWNVTPEAAALYRQAIADVGSDGRQVNNQIGAMFHVYCHEDERIAIERGTEAEAWLVSRYTDAIAGQGFHPRGDADAGTLLFGRPEAIAEKLRRFKDMGVDQVLCWFRFGMLPDEQVEASMRLLAQEVIPQFAGSLYSAATPARTL